MIHPSDVFAFCVAAFIALAFTSAGLYLTDELSSANQLHQLGEGHQLTFHEDKYGFYDGTVDKSITGTNYVMTYSLLTPMISLPIYLFTTLIPYDTVRFIISIFWFFVLISVTTAVSVFYRNKLSERIYYFYGIIGVMIFLSVIFYTPFETTYLEVLSIVTTNVILYGIFGAVIWKSVSYLFYGEDRRIFMWIAIMSCSSLLFWVGTLKDHMLIALLFMVILYSVIKFYDLGNKKHLLYSAVASGLIIWGRPELSIVIVPIICSLLIYKFRNRCIAPLYTYGLVLGISIIPMFINNYIVTGSFIKFPFQAVKQTMGGFHLETSNTIFDILFNEIPRTIIYNISTISIDNIIGIMIYPLNGGVGLLPIIMIPLIILTLLPYFIFVKKVKLIEPEKILFIFSFITIIIYLFTLVLGFFLHAEKGILPDMRYFSLVYAPMMVASLSILSRLYHELNYKKLLKNLLIWFGIMLIIFTIIVSILSINGVMTITNINLAANIISIIVCAISIAFCIDVIRTNRYHEFEIIIPIIISIPLTWQIFTSIFVAKLYSYPMYISLMELVKVLVFG